MGRLLLFLACIACMVHFTLSMLAMGRLGSLAVGWIAFPVTVVAWPAIAWFTGWLTGALVLAYYGVCAVSGWMMSESPAHR